MYRAAAGPINVADVKNNATDNIHAGAKMLRHKVVTYFDDRAVDPLNVCCSGQETVNYVGNVYKYYVAYKLSEDH